MRDSEVPVPAAFLMSAEYTLTRALAQELRRAVTEPLADHAFEIAGEMASYDLVSRFADAEPLLRQALEAHAERLRADPLGPDLGQVHRLLDLAETLGVVPSQWQTQNAYHTAVQDYREMLTGAGAGEEQTREFWRLGERLNFNMDRLRAPVAAPR